MSIRYMPKGDEDQCAAFAPIKFEDDTASWAGVQRCGATIALAAVLTATALSTMQAATVDSYHQDDPAGKLFGQDDEDFWQNPVAPIPAVLGRLYLPDPEEIPATTLRGQPDEDFWSNPVAPVQPWTPFIFRDDDVVTQPVLGIDEDLWENPVAAVPASLGRIYLPDPEEISAGNLFGQPDEDYWQNPVRPVVWPAPPLAFRDDDVITQAVAPVGADEDYWSNAVAPAPAKFGQLYLPDPEELPAASFFGQPSEDFWIPPAQQLVTSLPKLFADDDVIGAAAVSFVPDEDLWFMPRPSIASAPAIVFADDSVIVPQPAPLGTDEDFWISPPIARVWPPAPKFFADDNVLFPAAPGPFVGVAKGFRFVQSLNTMAGVTVVESLIARVTAAQSLEVAKFAIVAIP